MGDVLYCRPSDLIIPSATLSVTSGTADSGYPVTNLQNRNPAKPFKATGTSVTVRATYGAPVTARAVSFGPHNLVGATVSLTNNNASPLNRSITVPANALNGLSVDPFDDFSAVTGSLAATQWNLVISGASANVAIGEWHLALELRILRILIASGFPESLIHGNTIHPTSMGGKLKSNRGWAVRRFTGRVLVNRLTLAQDLATLRALAEDARGQYGQFLLIPDSAKNDALYVDLNVDEQSVTWQNSNRDVGYVEIEFIQVQRGPRL